MKHVLIVEDDIYIGEMLKDLLTKNGYDVINAYSGTEAVLLLEKEHFQLVLLDLMLPGMNGREVLSVVKEKTEAKVIIMSAISDLSSKVELLKKGADDYLIKPFHNDELLARMEAVLRRGKEPTEEATVLQYKDLVLDKGSRVVTIQGEEVSLTKREFLILELLMSYPCKVFTKNNIFESVYQEQFVGEDNTINVHISNIRQKLAKVTKEEYIETVWGIGFRMCH